MKRLGLITLAFIVCVGFAAPLLAQDAGKKVFDREKCAMCHTATKNSLASVGTKLTADQIREWIVSPKEAAQKANTKAVMPPKKLSKDDLDALVAYLQTMKK